MKFAKKLRKLPTPVIGRINDGALVLDLRCLEKDIDLIKIFDITGKLIRTFKNISANQSVNIESIKSGYYLLKLESSGHIYNKKLIKR